VVPPLQVLRSCLLPHLAQNRLYEALQELLALAQHSHLNNKTRPAMHRQQQADAVATAGVIPADTEAQSAATIQGGSSSAAEKSAEPDLTSPGSFSA
jgi:hypothetical protein